MDEAPKILKATGGRGRFRVQAIAIVPDQGLIVHLLGGAISHVGAVALGIPRPSLRDPRRLSATSSVITVVGHKDDELAKPLAEELARRLGRVTVVVAGLHLERAAPEEIEALVANSQQAAGRLLARLGGLVGPDKEIV